MATRVITSYNSPMRKSLVVAGLLGLWAYPSRVVGGPAGEAEGYVDSFGGWASPQRVAFTLTQSGGPPIAVSPSIVAGLAWGLSPDWYLFGEWRRTEFNTTSETVNSIFWPTQRGTVSLAVRSDHYYLGLSRRFRPRLPAANHP